MAAQTCILLLLKTWNSFLISAKPRGTSAAAAVQVISCSTFRDAADSSSPYSLYTAFPAQRLRKPWKYV